MSGNAAEWCDDRFDPEQKDRVLRGGSWMARYRGDLRSCDRANRDPGLRNNSYGFRVVLAPAPSD
jgi:formylglycine-generating enzyme required for sulfatase activity